MSERIPKDRLRELREAIMSGKTVCVHYEPGDKTRYQVLFVPLWPVEYYSPFDERIPGTEGGRNYVHVSIVHPVADKGSYEFALGGFAEPGYVGGHLMLNNPHTAFHVAVLISDVIKDGWPDHLPRDFVEYQNREKTNE